MEGRVVFDFSNLRGRIKAVYATQADFAQRLGISVVALSNKLNNKTDWTAEEIYNGCHLLGIDIGDAHDFYFVRKSL